MSRSACVCTTTRWHFSHTIGNSLIWAPYFFFFFHIANQCVFYLSSLNLNSLRHEIILEGKPHHKSHYLIT